MPRLTGAMRRLFVGVTFTTGSMMQGPCTGSFLTIGGSPAPKRSSAGGMATGSAEPIEPDTERSRESSVNISVYSSGMGRSRLSNSSDT